MAEDNAAQQQQPQAQPAGTGGGQKPTIWIAVLLVNMLVLSGVGFMLYMNVKQKEADPGLDPLIKDERQVKERQEVEGEFIGQSVPLETFLVNLADSRGRKIAKVNMEFEVTGTKVEEEIDQLKPKIRDIIIIILSSKTYLELSNKDGRETLKEEIRDQVNLFLTKGQIKKVYFTEFIFN